MAGHLILREKNGHKALDKLYHGVVHDLQRNAISLRGSLKYEQIENNVFVKSCTVPASIVTGGQAIIEVHADGKKLNAVYLVA